MKPTTTAHTIRKILKELKSDIRVDNDGYVTSSLEMPDPSSYTDAKAFATDYLAYNIARKRSTNSATPLQMRNALEKWSESEFRCGIVNRCHRWVSPVCKRKRRLFMALTTRAATIISNVLCDAWPELDFNPTAGATATTSRKMSFPAAKVDGTPLVFGLNAPHKCAPGAKILLQMMFEENPGVARRYWKSRHKIVEDIPVEEIDVGDLCDWLTENVPPAALDYVPKDVNEVRLIAKSNSLSVMVQKTLGDAIRKSLMKVGVNLNDQSINQEWAEIGSLTGIVATVDLSAASDSISLAMLNLFPERWRAMFLASRDSHVAVKGVEHKLNMVAGMGNGYIFELESLLFYALTRAVVEELDAETSWISVYGDDIIVPSQCVPLLEEFLLSLGFLLNGKKSFSQGPFRESCGKHYFNGVDVSPWFVRGNLDNVSDIYHLYNGLSDWQHRTGVDISEAIRYVYSLIPRNERCMVPQTWGTRTGLLWPQPDSLYPARRWNRNHQCHEYRWSAMAETTIDVTERVPGMIAVVNWLIAAERRDYLVDDTIWDKVRRPHLGKWRSAAPLVSTPAKLTWKGMETRRRYRSVSFGGDA